MSSCYITLLMPWFVFFCKQLTSILLHYMCEHFINLYCFNEYCLINLKALVPSKCYHCLSKKYVEARIQSGDVDLTGCCPQSFHSSLRVLINQLIRSLRCVYVFGVQRYDDALEPFNGAVTMSPGRSDPDTTLILDEGVLNTGASMLESQLANTDTHIQVAGVPTRAFIQSRDKFDNLGSWSLQTAEG